MAKKPTTTAIPNRWVVCAKDTDGVTHTLSAPYALKRDAESLAEQARHGLNDPSRVTVEEA